METWKVTVPVRFEQIGRLMSYVDEQDWKHVFRRVLNLQDVYLNGAKRDELDGDFIFVLQITDTSWTEVEKRVLLSLRRGIKERQFGTWTMLEPQPVNEAVSVPELSPAPVSSGAVPLDRDEVDVVVLNQITIILERLADQNGWYMTDWRYEMSCSCGPIDVRLLRNPPDGEIVEVKRGHNRKVIWLVDAPKQLESVCRGFIEAPPAQSNL